MKSKVRGAKTPMVCACGCGARYEARKADVERGWGRYFSKSCKAKVQAANGTHEPEAGERNAMEQNPTEKKTRGRKTGFRKDDPLNVSKGLRFTEGEYKAITKAVEVSGKKESEFMRDAIDKETKKVLKSAGINPAKL